MKKLLLCLCSIGLLFTLAACGGSSDGELSDAESVAKAKTRLYYDIFENNIINNFDLTVDCAFGVTASYVSSNTEVIAINGSVAKVTRPAANATNAEVKLTATLTKGEARDTIEYNVVVEKLPSFTVVTLESVANGSQIGNLVKVEGAIVIGVQKYCLYVTDNNKIISVNGPTANAKVGDRIDATGTVFSAFGMPTIGSQNSAAIVEFSGSGEVTLEPTVVTLEEIIAWTNDTAPFTGYSQVTGTLSYLPDEKYDNYRLIIGDTFVSIHYHSSIANELKTLDGQEITINFGIRSEYNGIWGIYGFEIVK